MKTQRTFPDVLNKIEQELIKMKEETVHIRLFYENGNMEAAYKGAMKLEELSEKLTLLTRALPVYTGNPGAFADIDRTIAESIPVEIGFTIENWFSVRLPMLLPRKEAGSAGYVRSFLYPVMQDFFIGKDPVRYRDCVLIYRHVYDAKRPERRKRDHDNIEINMVTDIVALYVMPDDEPDVCSHYYCSAEGEEERTEVYVVPKKDFPAWIVIEKVMPKEGVKLYEERSKQAKKHM